MNRKFLSIVFVLAWFNLFCQQEWQLIPKIERNAYTILEGSIANKYAITMYLETHYGFCGPFGDHHNPRIIKGWYLYKNIGKRIPLIGSGGGDDRAEYFLKLYVPENLLDTLNKETCGIDNFREMFFIPLEYESQRYSMDSMQWSMSGQANFLPVYLNETHSSSLETIATLNLHVDKIDLLEINLSKLTSNDYIDKIEIESAKEYEGNFYFIIRYGHLTSPGYFGSGGCGAGWEEWLGLLVVNSHLETIKFEYYQTASCEKSFQVEYYFDKEHPEKGISLKK